MQPSSTPRSDPGTVPAGQPTPALAITGPRATITGVPFDWTVGCWSCRKRVNLASIGQIIIELHCSATLKTCSWSFKTRGGKAPLLLPECPECGNAGNWADSDWSWLQRNPNYTSRPGAYEPHPWPAFLTYPSALQAEAYATLRAAFPAGSAKADAALRRT